MRRAPPLPCVIIAALALALPNLAAAKTYRWVDAQGKVHYSDQAQAKAAEVDLSRPGLVAPNPPAVAGNVASAEECGRRKSMLDQYQHAATITETDGLGRKRDYSEAERKELIARQRRAITDGGCNSSD